MKKLLNNLSLYLQTVPNSLRKRRLLVWMFFILGTVFMSFGIMGNNFDMTLDSWFSDDDPIKVTLTDFRDEFGSDDGIFIVYKPKDGDVFSEASLKAVRGIRKELLELRQNATAEQNPHLKHITKIDNILSAKLLKVEQDALVSRKLIGGNLPKTAQEREAVRQEAAQQRGFKRIFFSENFQYGGIAIETDLGTIPLDPAPEKGFTSPGAESQSSEADESGFDETQGFAEMDQEVSMEVDETAIVEKVQFKPVEMADYLGLMDEIDLVLNKPEYRDHLEYFPVGNAPMIKIFMEMMMEMGPLYTGMLLVIVILLWTLFKSLATVVWPLIIVVLSTVWTVGFFGWINTTITNMVTLTVMLILAVGIADSIHILSGYLFFRNKGQDHQEALNSAFLKSALPCLLTAITTMAGMLALTVTPISHIRVFGFSSAFGVGMAYFFTIYLLPLMLDLWSPVKDETGIKPQKSKQSKIVKGITLVLTPFLSMIRLIGKLIPDSTKILQPLLIKVLPWVEKRPLKVIVFFSALFAVCVYGATQVKIDSNVVDATREGHQLRIIYDTVDKHMMGAQNMEILVDMGAENALQNPQVLNTVALFQKKLETG